MTKFQGVVFWLLSKTRLKRKLYFRYEFNFRPNQLSYFIDCLDKTSNVNGDILEIGIDRGHTTVFLKKHMQAVKNTKKYICLDLFSKSEGFVDHDVEHEVKKRGKEHFMFDNHTASEIDDIKYILELNKICENVEFIKADVSEYKFKDKQKFSFCLLDVDLYLPTLAALEKIYPKLESGGIIVIDDCQDNKYWDGALQAYKEFINKYNLEEKVILDKLGIIEKR